MPEATRAQVSTATSLLALILAAGSACALGFAAMSYPYRLDTLEKVTVPHIKHSVSELRAEVTADRRDNLANRELLIRIEERLVEMQRKLDAQRP
jgi:hypothetical protein